MEVGLRQMPGLIVESFKGRKERGPSQPIPMVAFDAGAFMNSADPVFCWFGHSALLLRIAGKTLFIDPMLGDDCSPIGPIRTRRYTKDVLSVIDQLPPIDLALITHDHYDHLDYSSIKRLSGKVSQWYVGLGISRHLESWGVDADLIQQFDWWDDAQFHDIHITYTPSQHFSGRGVTDRAKSLWGGWVLKTFDKSVYWSGDGGYRDHFAEVGRRLGPFDITFVECGQYNERWHMIHLYPEEAVQAAVDAQCRMAVPVHWGGFTLALHHWTDPIERFVKAANESGQLISTPRIGEIFGMETALSAPWWAELQ